MFVTIKLEYSQSDKDLVKTEILRRIERQLDIQTHISKFTFISSNTYKYVFCLSDSSLSEKACFLDRETNMYVYIEGERIEHVFDYAETILAILTTDKLSKLQRIKSITVNFNEIEYVKASYVNSFLKKLKMFYKKIVLYIILGFLSFFCLWAKDLSVYGIAQSVLATILLTSIESFSIPKGLHLESFKGTV